MRKENGLVFFGWNEILNDCYHQQKLFNFWEWKWRRSGNEKYAFQVEIMPKLKCVKELFYETTKNFGDNELEKIENNQLEIMCVCVWLWRLKIATFGRWKHMGKQALIKFLYEKER